ncbi:S13-like H2TH domain-containing protein [Ceraceosorus guamensis]|uniref:S13-like H2TH domain-containing protein n=1 Tax=Ceraceosorus guamensis TaxID=1522189 RepID=A0A316VQ47_9BASI|nr:S13-like H2TH domain-containing protein [Ceraceosorus guamensis]PWN39374.1 S13-like H2TH domain-containing protein [Ceraceosorus guamensis]
MYLLGAHLPDDKLVRIALTAFYGIGYSQASKLCSRLSLHKHAKVENLTDAQINLLSAYLSSPGSIPARPANPTTPDVNFILSDSGSTSSSASPSAGPGASSGSEGSSASDAKLPPSQRHNPADDPLRSIVLEADLRRVHVANITHHRTVGSYKGRRHAQGFPVRGQRTQTNARTAKKLNRIERRGFSTSTFAQSTSSTSSSSRSPGPVTALIGSMARPRFAQLRNADAPR